MRQRNAKCKGLTGHQSLKGKIRVPDLNDRLANLGCLVQFQLFLSCAINETAQFATMECLICSLSLRKWIRLIWVLIYQVSDVIIGSSFRS